MARSSDGPWYRSQTRTWYATRNGGQIPLVKGDKDETAKEALKEWHRVMGQTGVERVEQAETKNKAIPVGELCERYAQHVRDEMSPEQLRNTRWVLNMFAGKFENRRTDAIAPKDVDAWIGLMKKKEGEKFEVMSFGDRKTVRTRKAWSVNTIWRIKVAIKAMFAWGAKQDWIKKNPMLGLERPKQIARTEILSDADFGKMLSHCRFTDLRHLLLFIRYTGCRPFEALQATAADIDWTAPAIRFHKDRTKQKKKDRLIMLTGDATDDTSPLSIIKQRIGKHPDGLLWRDRSGKKPRDIRQLAKSVQILARKAGVKATLYTLRHTYITDALQSGLSAAIVAELCGTSIMMIQSHYGHLERKTAAMLGFATTALATARNTGTASAVPAAAPQP